MKTNADVDGLIKNSVESFVGGQKDLTKKPTELNVS
jgi:hypothetical protein